MCVCVCVYVFVCASVSVYVCVVCVCVCVYALSACVWRRERARACIHEQFTDIRMHECVCCVRYVCMHAYMQTVCRNTRVSMHAVRLCVCVYSSMYVCMYTCAPMCVSLFTNALKRQSMKDIVGSRSQRMGLCTSSRYGGVEAKPSSSFAARILHELVPRIWRL